MAFRRRFKARGVRAFRGRSVKSTVRRSLATAQRSKADWAQLPVPLNPCKSFRLSNDENPDNGCPNGAELILIPGSMDPVNSPANPAFRQDDEGFYVHKLEVDLFIVPVVPADVPLPPFEQVAFFRNLQTLLRVVMVKQRWQISQDGSAHFNRYNPLKSTPDFSVNFVEGDYTEGPYMRTWQKFFEGVNTVDSVFYPGTCCPDVSGGSTINVIDLTSGTGGGNIDTSIDTTCNVCVVDGEGFELVPGAGRGPYATLHSQLPRSWHLRIRVNTRLHFKEADGLHLFFGWENMSSPDLSRQLQPELLVRGIGRALVSR